MQFFKMQNCGNDYIYLFEKPKKGEIVKLCDRNFGIGGDGVVYVYENNGKYGYEIFNSDGSKASFCGNVSLSLGLYIYKVTGEKSFEITTDSGTKKIEVLSSSKRIKVGVEIGKPHFQEKKEGEKESVFNKLLFLKKQDGRVIRIRCTLVNVGNLHLVVRGIYSKKMREEIVELLNATTLFKCGINVEFVERRKNCAKVIVYERGSGKTLCCASGGAAVFATLKKTVGTIDRLKLEFEGGNLFAKYKGENIWIHGYPQFLFFGECEDLCK